VIEPLVAALLGGLAGAVGSVVVRGVRDARRNVPAAPLGPELPGPYDDDRTQRVLAALPFAAFLIDARGIVRFVNPAAEALFGIRSARVIGQGLIVAVPSVPMERQVFAAIRGETSTRDVVIGEPARERTLGITAHPFEGGALVISAIKLMIETVLVSDDDAEARTLFLPQIAREVDRMIRLVEDLLELARSESGNVVLHRERFDLTDIATAVVNTFAQRSLAGGVELELEAPEEVFVEADRHRLTQVGVNLVDNALRHTPPGGMVTVEVVRENDAAVLRVRDTGRGIPYHDLPHIFERFYVVDRSRSREHTGTGLGLSIARHLVELHGGALTAQSVYGRGATFVCRLPPAPLDAAPAAADD
jgi:signal transduction histidine kinase